MSDQNNPHFKELFFFCVLTLVLGFGYIVAVTFIQVPKENQRVVDTATGFVLGSMIMSAIGFLLGGNPTMPKKPDTNVNQMSVDAGNVNVSQK